MTRSEPRLAWTMPSGAVLPDSPPPLSRGGAREALWALGLSIFVHAGLMVGLGSIVLAARVAIQPTVLEVAVVAAAEAPPAAAPDSTPAAVTPPPAEAAPVGSAAPSDPSPAPPEPKAPAVALPEAPADATVAQPAETPPKPEPPAPRVETPPAQHADRPAAPRVPPQLAAKPPALPPGHGVDGITNAKPTELSATASFRPVVAPPLTYPPIAIRLGEEGTVGLLVAIDAEGTPQEVTVQKSSGFGSLDEEAVRTMRRWRFSPPHKNGLAGPVTIYIPMVFKLKHHDG
jgi:protein TonB